MSTRITICTLKKNTCALPSVGVGWGGGGTARFSVGCGWVVDACKRARVRGREDRYPEHALL